MSRILRYLPELQGTEQLEVARLMGDLTDEEVVEFSHAYRARRKDPSISLVMALVGLAGLAGLQRFYLGQIGMGLLYFFTGGLCAIGTIVDAVRHQKLTADYNLTQAVEIAQTLRRTTLAEQQRLKRLAE